MKYSRTLAAMLLFTVGCVQQPKLECDPGVESDETAMTGVLLSGESLTLPEEFLGFGRFASFRIEKDCDFVAYAQSTELGGWQRTHVGAASAIELQSILSPLISRATWSEFAPSAQVQDSSSLRMELDLQWEFDCDDCSVDELDRDFVAAVNELRALGGPDPSAMVDVMVLEPNPAPATSIAWPFHDVPGSASWSGDVHSLSLEDSSLARSLWEDYTRSRTAAWPSHEQAVYAESTTSEFALYFRESELP